MSSITSMTCERCGALLPEEARFCPRCGAPVAVPATEERKVVTILFADLADSTRLASSLDAERFREVVGAFYREVTEELESLRGRAEKFVGDAVMAVFGVPHAHEDDALRGIRAGLLIRDRMARLGEDLALPLPLRVRVGVNSGPVATGAGPSGQFLVTGTPVNLAARLQQAADPDEVLVGETTVQLTRDAVEFGPDRVIPAKGFEGEVRAWPVVALSPRSTRRTIPIVGRRSELALLSGAFERVRETSRAHLVTILGEPGIGKTRLADEFLATLPEGTRVLAGRAGGFEDDVTFAPLADMIRHELGVEATAPPAEVRGRLQEVVEGCCVPDEVEGVAARLGLALGLGAQDREGHRYRIAEVRTGLLAFLTGAAANGPVVMVLEDLELARPAFLELLEMVVRDARRIPLMVLAVAREDLLEAQPGWGGGLADALTLRLEPLSLDDGIDLAVEAGDDIDAQTALRIAEHSAGNPFFIVETTGMIQHQHLEHVLGAAHSHLLPPTVQAVVASRLDHLPEDARDVVRKASVFHSSTFHEDELSLIADPKPDVMDQLEQEEVFVPGDRPGVWRFRHDVLRDVAYESLPKRERLRLHLRVAEELVKGEGGIRYPRAYAYHLEQAARASLDLDPTDEDLPRRAAAALARAGDQARRAFESRTAVDLYERALDLAPPEPGWGTEEAHVLAGMGEALYWLGDFPEARGVLDRALEVGGDDAWTRAHALRFLGDLALNVESDPDRAAELFEGALEAARQLDEPFAMARTLLMAGWEPFWRDDLPRARDMFEEALAIARENPQGDRWAESRALVSLTSVISPVGDEADCLNLGLRALAIGRELGDPFTLAVAQENVGNSLRRMWRLDEAYPYVEGAVRTFRELGARWELASALQDRGTVHRALGRLEEAEADLRESLAICRDLKDRSMVVWSLSELVIILLLRGDLDGARRLLREPLVQSIAGEPSSRVSMIETRSLIALAEGDREGARELALEGLEAQRLAGLRNQVAAETWWVGTLFGAEAVGGDVAMEEARRTLESARWINALETPASLLAVVG